MSAIANQRVQATPVCALGFIVSLSPGAPDPKV
jgi:hypothetical protein